MKADIVPDSRNIEGRDLHFASGGCHSGQSGKEVGRFGRGSGYPLPAEDPTGA